MAQKDPLDFMEPGLANVLQAFALVGHRGSLLILEARQSTKNAKQIFE